MKYRYRYHNANPSGEETEDCVTRAICTATGLKYQGVSNLLKLSSANYECETLCVDCYYHLLTNVLCYKPHYCNVGETVGDIANKYNDRKIIIRIKGHCTCSLYGIVTDIWDCTHKEADIFWIVD